MYEQFENRSGLLCDVGNCGRRAAFFDADDDDREVVCGRHRPDPSVRSWAEMKSEGIEIETMSEYVAEVRGFNDYDYEPD